MSAIILMIALLTAGHSMASEAACTRKLDIVFQVDGSTSVCNGAQTCPKWTSTLEFCKNIATSFKIGPNDTQIAFILMSDAFHVMWKLNGHTDVTTLLAAIDNVAYTGGTFTMLSLLSTLSLLTQVFNPSYGDRSDALNVIISITDGVPDINALLGSILSNAYQLLGIAVFQVCVRPDCTVQWISGMDSPPHKVNETYFMVDSYFLLNPVKDDLVNKVCQYKLW